MGAVLCTTCGRSFAGSLRERMVTCPDCGATIDQAVLRTKAVASPRDDDTLARPAPPAPPPTPAPQAAAFCPSCDAPGVVGAPCPERVCSLRAIHAIPAEYAARVRADPGASDPMVGQVIAGYLVVDLLGQGGFGKVLLALQKPLYRLRAALKLFAPAAPDERTMTSLLDKFQNEAATLAVLEHPNIVRLLGHGTHGDRPWLAMEFVGSARTLNAALATRMPLSAGRDVLVQLLNALEAAHAMGIVHRDIKPENVMLQSVVGSDHFVRLVDFGIAKTLDAGRKTSLVLGTPYYMAPEQLGGTDVGPWTDLYAVGVMAFELLTGKHLYGDLTSEEVLRRKIDPRFEPLALVTDADLAPPLRAVLAKALCREPAERYTSAAAMRQALEGALSTSGDEATELRAERAALAVERQAFEDERRKLADSKLEPPPVAVDAPKKTGRGLTVAIAIVVVAALAGGTVWAVKHFGAKTEDTAAATTKPAKAPRKTQKRPLVTPDENLELIDLEQGGDDDPPPEPVETGDAERRAACEKQVAETMGDGFAGLVSAKEAADLKSLLVGQCMMGAPMGGGELEPVEEPDSEY